MSFDYFRSLRILAAYEVTRDREERSGGYHLRTIFRWYSKEFHTPLHEVYDLDLHDILQAYYESTYEGWRDGDREENELLDTEIQDLVRSEAELSIADKSKDKEELEEDDFIKQLEKEAMEQFQKRGGKPIIGAQPEIIDEPIKMNFPEENDIERLIADGAFDR